MAIPGYKVLRKINEGGMATVHLAIQLSVGREVALKIMSPELSANPKYSNRFYKEANIVGTLSHPNIVSIYDVGKHDGYNYIAMDYLPGASFKERIGNGLSISEALRLTKEVASALDHMHDRGYVHLDLKPDNILFRKDGSAVLLDFGIAMTLSAAQKANTSGSVAGTPQYMSPEQAQGKPMDGRSDIYSLGILFHEMLTGEPPYRGSDAVQIAVKHMTAPLPSLPVQYKMFQPLLNRMLAKKPDDRFNRGNDIIQAINGLEGGIGGKSLLLEPTQPTALQAFSLIKALLAALGALLGLLLKGFFARFAFLGRLRFSRQHGLVLRKAIDPLEQPLNASGDTPTLDEEPLESALAHQRARRLAPPPVVYAGLGLLLIALGAGLFSLLPRGDSPAPSNTGTATRKAAAPKAQTPTAEEQIQAALAASRTFKLNVSTTPADAEVRLLGTGQRHDNTQALAPGQYTLEVSYPNYLSQQHTVDIVDADISLNLALLPAAPAYQGGETFQHNLADNSGLGPAMVAIPAGQFSLGDASGRLHDAKPVRNIVFERPFAIGRYEVTWSEYRQYLQSTGTEKSPETGGRSDNHPVTGVSWDDAVAYTAWLAQQTGKPYRLPSEAEWEYAARAGSSTLFWWGDSGKNQANCRRGCSTVWGNNSLFEPMPIGSFQPNRFGLYDTAGNAAEWVQDCYADSYQNTPTDGSAWQQSSCYHRVVRGGSFNDSDNKLQSRARDKGFGQMRKAEQGFRVAMGL